MQMKTIIGIDIFGKIIRRHDVVYDLTSNRIAEARFERSRRRIGLQTSKEWNPKIVKWSDVVRICNLFDR